MSSYRQHQQCLDFHFLQLNCAYCSGEFVCVLWFARLRQSLMKVALSVGRFIMRLCSLFSSTSPC